MSALSKKPPKNKEINVELLLWPNIYCHSEIMFSRGVIFLCWQGHGCCILVAVSKRHKVKRWDRREDRIAHILWKFTKTAHRFVVMDLIMTRWPINVGHGRTCFHASNWQRQREMLGEYQVIWIQCAGECHPGKLASTASIPPVAQDKQIEFIMLLIILAGSETRHNDSNRERHDSFWTADLFFNQE